MEVWGRSLVTKTGKKGHIWKAAYHTGRSLMNCTKILFKDYPDLSPTNQGFAKAAESFNGMIDHWKKIAAAAYGKSVQP